MIDGKLVERKDAAIPPDESWLVRSPIDGIWAFAVNPDDTDWLAREIKERDNAGKPYRVYHCTDKPPRLPDREKLAKWLHLKAELRDDVEWPNWNSLSEPYVSRYFQAADSVIALMRDGVPASLLADPEKTQETQIEHQP
jgi:hypothetical protein